MISEYMSCEVATQWSITLKNKFLDSSNTSSPSELVLMSDLNVIGPVLTQVREELEGSLKKSFASFSVRGLSKSLMYSATPETFGSSKALTFKVSLNIMPEVEILATSRAACAGFPCRKGAIVKSPTAADFCSCFQWVLNRQASQRAQRTRKARIEPKFIRSADRKATGEHCNVEKCDKWHV